MNIELSSYRSNESPSLLFTEATPATLSVDSDAVDVEHRCWRPRRLLTRQSDARDTSMLVHSQEARLGMIESLVSIRGGECAL